MGWEEGNQLEERRQPVEQATRRVQPGWRHLWRLGRQNNYQEHAAHMPQPSPA